MIRFLFRLINIGWLRFRIRVASMIVAYLDRKNGKENNNGGILLEEANAD